MFKIFVSLPSGHASYNHHMYRASNNPLLLEWHNNVYLCVDLGISLSVPNQTTETLRQISVKEDIVHLFIYP